MGKHLSSRWQMGGCPFREIEDLAEQKLPPVKHDAPWPDFITYHKKECGAISVLEQWVHGSMLEVV